MGFSCVKHDRDSRHFLLQTASLGRRRASTTFGQLRLSPFRTYSSRTYDGEESFKKAHGLKRGRRVWDRQVSDLFRTDLQNGIGEAWGGGDEREFPELEPSQFGTLFGLWIKGGWVNVHDYKLVHMRMGVGCKGCGGKLHGEVGKPVCELASHFWVPDRTVMHAWASAAHFLPCRFAATYFFWCGTHADGCRIISGAHWYPYYQGRATERAIEGFLLGPRLPA
eukprot:1154305-Pelagomonas_calceolata.AAC.7